MARIRNSGKSLTFTKQSYNELAAVVYADLFGYPLTVKESKLWAIRKNRQEASQIKYNQASQISIFLKRIATIEAIFLTGSVAIGNAKKDADIDLMIVTKPTSLWLTRLVVFGGLKLIGKLKKPYCPNIFVDTDHLEVQDKNLYTAHEVLQVKCLFDKNNIEKKWLKENKWTKEYLPKAYFVSLRALAKQSSKIPERIASSPALCLPAGRLAMTLLEIFVFIPQYLYMKRKMTNEKIGWGYAFFHPKNYSKSITDKFEQRLLKYSKR